MPRAADATYVTSESEGERVQTGSTKKTYASKKRRAVSASESDVEEVEEVNDEPEETTAEGEEDEVEEEYEIEKILDAKKGQFSGGRMGYFVKWKGYDEQHNSWVDERDAGNAKDLIDRFWAEKKKSKPGPRKSEPIKSKPKPVEKPSRKSLIELVDSSVEPEIHVKKRGRAKKDEQPSDKIETRDEDEDEHRAKKKPRRSNGLPRQEKRESDEDTVGNMKKHMKAPSWEELIDTIDTVEREEDELYVFFTLKADKKRVRENSRLCAEKFPQKLIMFYESNLRWKTEEPIEG
ncbi:hypothetical protein EV363DRAFT_1425922 [Boletus edulis]|uniref:Chromo domain-containing protein n=1 Tax=Boletus edulis BED1 TaxID=1328754 RepID=A0AAD4C672_BOLED|nr:hypothetical protein EV363DRAFT_1425922 [Boletus edulis]KAF8449319.1 hypothetical protein L210DRAFT_3618906 [Boletus edulis BED1]